MAAIPELLTLAMRHHQAGDLIQAEQLYRQVLHVNPSDGNALHLLGMLAQQQGRPQEAVSLLHQALAAMPLVAEVHYNLGWILARQGKPDEAQAAFEQAVRIRPGFAEALDSLGTIYQEQGRIDEALACFRQALAANPELGYVHTNLLMALPCHAAFDPDAYFAEQLRWGRRFAKPRRSFARQPDRTPGGRLRVGYVSPDFREHVVGRYIDAVIAEHDRRQFEVFCYSNVRQEDERTRRINARSDHWRSIVDLSDAQAADLIRADGIDLLVDLAGYTADNRLGVFADKPAPVQVTHYGWPGTGLAAIDYRLTDAFCDPPGQTEQWFCEKLVRLPGVHWCYVPWSSLEVGPLPAERTGAITFGCFNSLARVTEEMIGVWTEILRGLAGARMLIVAGGGKAGTERVRAAFGRQGIGPERLVLVEPQRTDAFMRLLQTADIALDTYPFTGCNATADALWMGVPVISRAGRAMITRQSVGLLASVGLEDLVADSPRGYLEAATRLANDLPRLQELRRELRERVKTSLANVARFVHHLEAAYRDMWHAPRDESPRRRDE